MSSPPTDDVPDSLSAALSDSAYNDPAPSVVSSTTPVGQSTEATPTTVDPVSLNGDSTEQVFVTTATSPSPELESLSSSSELDDQFYDATEDSPAQLEQEEGHSEDTCTDIKEEEKLEDSNLELDGVHEGDSSFEQPPIGSIEREFIMVNYPVDTQQDEPISPSSLTTRSTPTQVGFSTEEPSSSPAPNSSATGALVAQSLQLEEGRDLSLESDVADTDRDAESAQITGATISEVITGNLDEENVGDDLVVEGEEVVEREPRPEGEEEENVNVPAFESLGLLYAKSSDLKHNRDLLKPADEVAEDVLEVFTDIEADELLDTPLSPDAGRDRQLGAQFSAIDPGVLFQMEKHAQAVASELSHVMDGLRNSLHAMTVCTKQSIQLHRESVDNLHSIVDANIKGMYTFMAKFEELNKSLEPLKSIAAEIHDVDEKLQLLEQTFRVNAPKSSVQSSIRTH